VKCAEWEKIKMKEKIFQLYAWIIRHLSPEVKLKFRRIRVTDKINTLFRTKFKPGYIITKKEKHKIFLDSDDSLHLSVHKDWEVFVSKIMYKYVKKGDIVLDLGANIGYYSLLLAKLVGDNGKVYSFEPDPDNFKLLKKNIKANDYHNIVAIQKAVSDRTGKIRLFLEKDNSTMHKIYRARGENCTTIEIESVSLDDFFKDKNKKINFIKMDIEGAEGGAIKGMQKLLDENDNIIIFSEFCPRAMRGCGIGPEEYFKLLSKFGFIFYNVNEEENKIERTTPEEITLIYNSDGYTNILCIKDKNKDIIENQITNK